MSKKFSASILKQIKNQQLSQRPKWHYMLKDGIFWGIFFLSIFLGAIGFAVVLYAFLDTDFDLLSYTPTSQFTHFLKLLPFLWGGLFLLFSILAVWGAQHTKKGYRYPALIILLINILITLGIGSGIYASGGSVKLDQAFAQRVPFYKTVEQRRINFWRNPTAGFLSGTIQKIDSDTVFILNDRDNHVWRVDISDARTRRPITWRPQMKVRIIGKRLSEDSFKAHRIGPWEIPPQKFNTSPRHPDQSRPPRFQKK